MSLDVNDVRPRLRTLEPRIELRVPVILPCVALSLARGQSDGADACPCLAKTSPAFASLPAAAVAKGLPSTYGQEGCAASDKGQTATDIDCKTNAKDYRLKQWCFIDIELCVENKTRYETAGGKLGSDTHASVDNLNPTQVSQHLAKIEFVHQFRTKPAYTKGPPVPHPFPY